MTNPEPNEQTKTMAFHELSNRCKTELVVAIDEEYGYRSWLWFPGIPAQTLEAWWENLTDICTFWGHQGNGPLGKLQNGWPGEFFRADDSERHYDLFDAVWKSAPYRAYVDINEVGSKDDPDSFLQREDKTIFIHKGATFTQG